MNAKIKMRQFVFFIISRKFDTADIKSLFCSIICQFREIKQLYQTVHIKTNDLSVVLCSLYLPNCNDELFKDHPTLKTY